MTRITVLAADKPFGSSIVATANSREMAVTAVAHGPSQHSGAHRSVKTLHADMLDLTCPESLFDACDVLVVPLGSTEVHNVDFATDLHVATVLCWASEQLAPHRTRLVLAGRAPPETALNDGGNGTSLLQDGARILADHAALGIYAAHMQIPWTFVTPYRRACFTELHDRWPGRFREFTGHGSIEEVSNASYVSRVVDVIERYASDELHDPPPIPHSESIFGVHAYVSASSAAVRSED